eukprot:scaffold20686_cov84-Isochrysis_galbana.AAC.1
MPRPAASPSQPTLLAVSVTASGAGQCVQPFARPAAVAEGKRTSRPCAPGEGARGERTGRLLWSGRARRGGRRAGRGRRGQAAACEVGRHGGHAAGEEPLAVREQRQVVERQEDLRRWLVHRKQDGGAGGSHCLEHADEGLGGVGVEAGGWLIKQRRRRARRQHARHRHPLALAARQPGTAAVARADGPRECDAVKPHGRDGRLHQRGPHGGRGAGRQRGGGGEADGLVRREGGLEHVVLRRVAQRPPRQPPRLGLAQPHRAAHHQPGRPGAGEGVEQGGLTGARRAHERTERGGGQRTRCRVHDVPPPPLGCRSGGWARGRRSLPAAPPAGAAPPAVHRQRLVREQQPVPPLGTCPWPGPARSGPQLRA